MASIERAKTQRSGYVVRYRGPDRKPRSKTFKRKADAESFLRTVEADVMRGTWVDPNAGKILLRDWGTQWWDTTVNLRPSTRARDNATYRNHIEPAFGAVPIASINHLAVRQWVAKLSASGLAPATVHKAYQVLSKILRSAVDADLIVGSPCDRVPLPRIERHEMRFLDPDGVAHLANTIDPRYRAFVLLGAYGGLRSGELFALRRERLDLVQCRVDVAETAVEVAGHELVFSAPEGGPIRASLFRRRTWDPAVAKAGLAPLRPHDLRHTAVALWIAAGASAHEVARRAGHTSSSVVLDRYGHLLPHAEERVTNALDNLGRAGAANARGAIVLELPREERAKNGPQRERSRLPRTAAPALTRSNASGASWNRTSDLILIRDAL